METQKTIYSLYPHLPRTPFWDTIERRARSLSRAGTKLETSLKKYFKGKYQPTAFRTHRAVVPLDSIKNKILVKQTLGKLRVGDEVSHVFLYKTLRSGFSAKTIGNSQIGWDTKQWVQTIHPRKKHIGHSEPALYDLNFKEFVPSWRGKPEPQWIQYETIRYRGFTNTNFIPTYQSCLLVAPTGTRAWLIQLNKVTKIIHPPAGMIFSKDCFGIRVVRLTDKMDYHPTDEEWQSPRFASLIRLRMADKYKKILSQKRYEQRQAHLLGIKNREIHSTRVTLADSLKAGNCLEGSLAYAERSLGIARDAILAGKHLFSVPATRILNRKNPEPRALRAVDVAWARETMVSI